MYTISDCLDDSLYMRHAVFCVPTIPDSAEYMWCGGSMVAHLTVILQSQVQIRHPSTCRSMSVPYWGANGVGIATAGWPLRGGRDTKSKKKILNEKRVYVRSENYKFLIQIPDSDCVRYTLPPYFAKICSGISNNAARTIILY